MWLLWSFDVRCDTLKQVPYCPCLMLSYKVHSTDDDDDVAGLDMWCVISKPTTTLMLMNPNSSYTRRRCIAATVSEIFRVYHDRQVAVSFRSDKVWLGCNYATRGHGSVSPSAGEDLNVPDATDEMWAEYVEKK